jgi:hypothetical protein
MIQQFSGAVVHIDFGDCFEVAMQRDAFPELVPFRLTRMLVQALEVFHKIRSRNLKSSFSLCVVKHLCFL